MEKYILAKDFNWFGKKIPGGSIYKQYQSTKDMFRCYNANGSICPEFDLTFLTVRSNPDWFTKVG